MSSVLFIDETGKLIDFVSKKHAGAKLKYPELYNVILVLVHTVRKAKALFSSKEG